MVDSVLCMVLRRRNNTLFSEVILVMTGRRTHFSGLINYLNELYSASFDILIYHPG